MSVRFVAALSLGLTLLLISTPTAAQTAPPASTSAAPARAAASDDESKGDIEAGLDLVMWVRDRGVTDKYTKGWYVGASYRITHLISVVATAGGDYRKVSGDTANIYTYSGGVRFQSGIKECRVRPFVQLLMGAAQDNGAGTGVANHYPVVSPGLGTDLALSHHAAVRIRLDFPLFMTFGDVFKGTRLAAGLTFPFGMR